MDLQNDIQQTEVASEPIVLLDGILRVAQSVRLRFNDWLNNFDLNDGRHSVLMTLAQAEAGVCSQAELALRLGQSESNVSTLIERMQRDGLVSRKKSEIDRRKRMLQITDQGRTILDAVEADRMAWSEKLLTGFRSDDRSRMIETLGRFSKLFEGSTGSATEVARVASTTIHERLDPSENPHSPQFALRQMLQALSSSSGTNEKEAA